MQRNPRSEILHVLRVAGPRTASELAEGLGCTPPAVRVHLRRLESERLVAPALERPPRGRPVARYGLTPAADGQFPERYDLFASRFVESVIQIHGGEALRGVLARWEDSLHAHFDSFLPKPPEERLRALARHQTAHGFMAEVEDDRDGVALVERNCPILELAKNHPEICAMETSLWSRTLKWKTTLAACRATGANACVFRIGRKKTVAKSGNQPAA